MRDVSTSVNRTGLIRLYIYYAVISSTLCLRIGSPAFLAVTRASIIRFS